VIELFTVKRWNDYDFVQDTLPASDGTWLCSLTASPYTRGHSYQVTGGTATRIEANKDLRIESTIHTTLENVMQWLNNWFYVSRRLQDNTYRFNEGFWEFTPIALARDYEAYESDTSLYTFASGVVTNLEQDIFQVGDLVTFKGGLRNSVSGYVTAQSTGQITIDNPNTKDTTELAVAFLSDIPTAVEQVVEQMINWDVFSRTVSDKKSERIGNYSYDNGDVMVGSLLYPSHFTTQLESYRRTNFVA